MTTETLSVPAVSASELIETVRALAREYPDFVYLCANADLGCSYFCGGDTEYPELQGCLIGQAFRRLNHELPDYVEGRGIEFLVAERFVKAPVSPADAKWLVTVQSQQDYRKPWAECVRMADDEASSFQFIK